MRDLLVLLLHFLKTLAQLLGSGGTRTVIAETLLIKHQLVILNRSRRRAPNLTTPDRIVLGLCTMFIRPTRIRKLAAVLRPATLLAFHQAMKERKYRRLFSPQRRGKPGPKGPSKELAQAIIETKRRNPRYGCPRIAQQLSKAFGIEINKDVVRRVLAKHHWPQPGVGGLSWLTFIGHTKDSLWSVDLFRCESITLKTHWVLVVMDQFKNWVPSRASDFHPNAEFGQRRIRPACENRHGTTAYPSEAGVFDSVEMSRLLTQCRIPTGHPGQMPLVSR